jgi:hypothetical protein
LEGLIHAERPRESRQALYAGADKSRERPHDVQIYRAYLRQAERLRE